MNAHTVKKCLIDCNFFQFFSVCNCIMDEIDKRGCPPGDIRLMAVLDGDTLQISAGTPENVERDIGIRPCV